MKKYLSTLLAIIACLSLAGCENESKNDNFVPLIATEQTATETEIKVTVTKLIETSDTKNVSNGGSGMIYNPSSGNWNYAYGMGGTSKVAVTKYYAILTDEKGTAYRFEFEGQDYALLSEGQEITVKQVNYDPPSMLKSSEFFWGNARIQFDADVTEMLSEVEEENTETEAITGKE